MHVPRPPPLTPPPPPYIPKPVAPTPIAKDCCVYGVFYVMLKSASCLATHGYLMAMLQVKIKFRLKFLNLI